VALKFEKNFKMFQSLGSKKKNVPSGSFQHATSGEKKRETSDDRVD